MTTAIHRKRQHDRERNEMSYQGSWGFPNKKDKYGGPRETPTERRWNAVLLAALALVNVIIAIRLALILWK